MSDPPGPDPIARTVVATLTSAGRTVAAAESLTGGLLLATLVGVPGASAVVRGGVVVYATELKATLGGVPADLLAAHGPVSGETAAALATSVRRTATATYGLATTGVAGPDPQDGHPPGEVWLGLAGPDGTTTRRLDLTGDRAAVRAGTVDAALRWLLTTLRATLAMSPPTTPPAAPPAAPPA